MSVKHVLTLSGNSQLLQIPCIYRYSYLCIFTWARPRTLLVLPSEDCPLQTRLSSPCCRTAPCTDLGDHNHTEKKSLGSRAVTRSCVWSKVFDDLEPAAPRGSPAGDEAAREGRGSPGRLCVHLYTAVLDWVAVREDMSLGSCWCSEQGVILI